MKAERIKNISPSMTLKVIETAANLKRSGADLIDLGAGEPDFPTPQFIQDAAVEAMKSGYTRYTKSSGIDELKEAVCYRVKKDTGLDYNPENVLVTAGGKQGIFNFFMSHLNKGDQVIVLNPYWVSFPEIVKIAGGEPVFVSCDPENDFQPEPEKVEAAITPATKAIIINSPCNPSGTVFSEKVVDEIVRIAEKYNLYIVSDDCYEAITFDKPYVPIAKYASDRDKVVSIHSLSKTYAMTGWRIGYTLASPEVISNMNVVQQQSTSCANSISQKAAVTALLSNQDSVAQMRKEYRVRRDFVVDYCTEIEGFDTHTPQGAFFTFHDISDYLGKSYNGTEISSSVEMCEYLLKSKTVATIPGSAFGMDHFIRISYATDIETLKEGLSRINEALKKLR